MHFSLLRFWRIFFAAFFTAFLADFLAVLVLLLLIAISYSFYRHLAFTATSPLQPFRFHSHFAVTATSIAISLSQSYRLYCHLRVIKPLAPLLSLWGRIG